MCVSVCLCVCVGVFVCGVGMYVCGWVGVTECGTGGVDGPTACVSYTTRRWIMSRIADKSAVVGTPINVVWWLIRLDSIIITQRTGFIGAMTFRLTTVILLNDSSQHHSTPLPQVQSLLYYTYISKLRSITIVPLSNCSWIFVSSWLHQSSLLLLL